MSTYYRYYAVHMLSHQILTVRQEITSSLHFPHEETGLGRLGHFPRLHIQELRARICLWLPDSTPCRTSWPDFAYLFSFVSSVASRIDIFPMYLLTICICSFPCVAAFLMLIWYWLARDSVPPKQAYAQGRMLDKLLLYYVSFTVETPGH